MKTYISTALMLSALFVASVQGSQYYVSSQGNDSNSGTSSSQPWKTVTKVESKMSQFTSEAQTQDVTIYFNNADTWLNDELKITCVGSADHWVTFDGTSWGNNPAGSSRATLRRSTAGTKVMVHIINSDGSYARDVYIIFQGFEVDGQNLVDNVLLEGLNVSHVKILNNKIHDSYYGEWVPTVHFTTSANVAGTIEIHDLEVSHNEVYGAGAHGVAFYPRTGSGLDDVANVTVTHNKIYNFGNSSSSSYGAGIQIVSCVGGVVYGNVIYDSYGSDGQGINMEYRNRRCRDIDIYKNLIYGGAGIELCVGISNRGGQNIDIYNNVIANTTSMGIEWGSGESDTTGRVFNNTILKTGTYAIGINTTSQITEFRNNIIYQTADERAINADGRIVEHSNNNFYNTTAGRYVIGWTYTTDTWVSGWEPSGKDGDPGFENINAPPTSFDSAGKMSPRGLNITTLGAAYDGAVDLSTLFNNDIDGDVRTGLWDIGADEYLVAGPADTEPPTEPTAVSAVVASSSQINLSWVESSDNVSVTGYRIFRDDLEVATSSTIAYSDSGLSESTLYTYTVCAYDAFGNESALSQPASAATPLAGDEMVSTSTWQNKSFALQSGSFDAEYDAVPNSANINAVTGLSSGNAAAYDDLAVLVRFNDSGQIDVRNGDVYTADTVMNYTAGTEYHFRIPVDLSTHTYSVYVQTGSGPETLLADNYAFRTSQSAIASLDTLALTAETGSHMISGFSAALPADTVEPIVLVSAPADGAILSGTVDFIADASDDTGVAGVQFKLDGANLGPEDTTPPYFVVWDTTGVADGSHTLTVVARDAAGNTKTLSTVVFTVNNEPPLGGELISATNTWENQSFTAQNGSFIAEFDAVPDGAPINAVTGLSSGNAAAYDDLAVIVRFNASGQIDVRNGGVYTAETAINYTAGTEYHFRIPVDLSTHTYSVYVHTGGGPETLLADNYAFRTSQSTAASLDTLAVTAEIGSHMVSGFSVSSAADPVAPGEPFATNVEMY